MHLSLKYLTIYLDRAYAEGMVKENECYIVRVANPYEFGTGGWYYMDGQEKKKMYLTGRNPAHELSYSYLLYEARTGVMCVA